MKNNFNWSFAILLFLLIGQLSFSQVSNFNLIVTKTDETCTGNGSLSFNVSGTTPGAAIVYAIYLLPNTTTPIATVNATTYTGLSAGNYRVIATQTLGSLNNTQQQDSQILDLRSVLTYQLTGQATSCSVGNITVNVMSGNPLNYEIISGPVIVAPQASNVFTNLTSGVYNIRVHDACGEAVVQTYTLNFVNLPNLTLDSFHFFCTLDACDSISGQFLVNANFGTSIRYPLTTQTTVHLPSGGTPLILNQTISSGDPSSQLVNLTIPYYNDQTYSMDIQVTDACGNVYTNNGIQIYKQLSVSATESYTNCLKGISIALCNYLPPYTVNFIVAPPGFIPNVFNANHPGPFSDQLIDYTSTTSNEMPNGDYIIEITDACGRSSQTQVTIHNIEPGYTVILNPDFCSPLMSVKIPDDVGPGVVSVIMTAASVNVGHSLPWDVSFNINASAVFLMDLLPGQYTFQGVDVCGNSFHYTITVPPRSVTISAIGNPIPGCVITTGSITVTVTNMVMTAIHITQAPISFNHVLPYDVSSSIINPQIAHILDLPIGSYTIVITDSCGITHTTTAVIANQISNSPLTFYERKGCGEGFDSIAFISPNGPLSIVKIIAAPATFPNVLPYDVSSNIAFDGYFYMNSFPDGNYTFYSKDNCGVERTETFQIIGEHVISNDIQVNGNCGSFDLNMNYSDNNSSTQTFWLQKYDAVSAQWVHPITGVAYPAGTIPNVTNSYLLNNFGINYNISTSGSFRILNEYYYFTNGNPVMAACISTVKTFDFSGDLKIVSANVLPCTNTQSQVVITAIGIAPLDYKITTKDGLPFVVNNGTSNVFTGLQPGIYNFRVQDLCGNIVNRLFDITTLSQPTITANNLCDGQNGSLSVQPFAFLNYQWWKGTDTTTILSTTNVLSFNPFLNTTTPGTYYVHIFSNNSNSCVDKILSFVIPATNNPNAGQDGTATYCGTVNSSINLFTLLTGTYDAGGVWEEISSSGMLSGNVWLPVGVPFGVYTFKYTVNGFCGFTDDATVVIHYNQAPEVPIITTNPTICAGETIQLSIQNFSNATFQWTGPDNFSSSTQNPILNNITVDNSGVYTVKVTIGGCESVGSVTINVNPSPSYLIDATCIDGAYTITITPNQNSFDATAVTYSWTGPNGFSSTNNPVVITGQPKGIYSITVTNPNGCSNTQSIDVFNTQCTIPKGVSPNEDGHNDTFDLSGFTGIRKVKIYNRYGMVVFEQENYVNEWHGQQKHSDKLLPGGTYYYYVEFESEAPKTGWVYLTRD